MPFVSVHIIVVGDPGADAAENAVSQEFDRIAPDIAQAVAAFVVDPPEASASHLVVAAGEENDFIAPDDPPVSPVQDGDSELVHPHVATVPQLLPVPDAEDIGSSGPMAPPVVAAVPSGRRRGLVTVMDATVVVSEFRRGGSPVGIMARLSRCAGNGEEQRNAKYLCFNDVFLLFLPYKNATIGPKTAI